MTDTASIRTAPLYAVIGRSENYPLLYHMNQPPLQAEQLRARREAATGRPCYIVTMAAWETDPRAALQAAEMVRARVRTERR
jgi:hypothetical protein